MNNFKWYPDALAYQVQQSGVLNTHLDPNEFNGSWTVEGIYNNTLAYKPGVNALPVMRTGLFVVGTYTQNVLFAQIPTQLASLNNYIIFYYRQENTPLGSPNRGGAYGKGYAAVSVDQYVHSGYLNNIFVSPAVTMTKPYKNNVGTLTSQTLFFMNPNQFANAGVGERLHAARVYNRPLSDTERTRHYEIDEIRYYLTQFGNSRKSTRGYIDTAGILRSKGDTTYTQRGLIIIPIDDTNKLRAGQTYRIINPKCIENPTFIIGYWNGASEPANNAQLTNVETIEGTNALITIPTGARYLVVYTHDSTTEKLHSSSGTIYSAYCTNSTGDYDAPQLYLFQERNDS